MVLRWCAATCGLAGVGPCKWMHSPDLCDPAAPHMADSESVCATWLAAGKTCASTWSEVCGATHSVCNTATPLSMSGCSRCMGSGGSGLGSGSSSGSGGDFPCVNGELDSTWGGDCDYLRYVVSNDVESRHSCFTAIATTTLPQRAVGAEVGGHTRAHCARRLQSPDPSVAPATPPITGWVPPSSRRHLPCPPPFRLTPCARDRQRLQSEV